MREVDRLMIDEVRVSLLQMMENAGRNLAGLAMERFAPRRVLVLAGPGGNGGGGLAAARHLANHGVGVEVRLLGGEPVEATHRQRLTLAAMKVPMLTTWPPEAPADLVIDAMVGYSLVGSPRGAAARAIDWSAAQPAPLLSLDVPSGFDAGSGRLLDPHVNADATLTLAAPKRGMESCAAAGEVYVGDISVPPAIFERVAGRAAPPFQGDWVVRLLP